MDWKNRSRWTAGRGIPKRYSPSEASKKLVIPFSQDSALPNSWNSRIPRTSDRPDADLRSSCGFHPHLFCVRIFSTDCRPVRKSRPAPPRPCDLADSCGQAGQNGSLPEKARPQRRCARTWSRFRRKRFLLRSIHPSDTDRSLYISSLDFCPVLGYFVTQNENQRQGHGLHLSGAYGSFWLTTLR